MNPLDLFILGVCMGASRHSAHRPFGSYSRLFVFDHELDLRLPLIQVGLLDWWETVYRRRAS